MSCPQAPVCENCGRSTHKLNIQSPQKMKMYITFLLYKSILVHAYIKKSKYTYIKKTKYSYTRY